MFGSFNFEKKIGMDKNTKSKLFFFFESFRWREYEKNR